MITQEYLKSILDYNKNTGVFIWKISKQRLRAGSVAGWVNPKGYSSIQINGKKYQAHRLAWLYVYGSLPICIDHIDGFPNNNKINNLREATSQQNSFNRKISKSNTSGIKGLTWHKKLNKWQAVIGLNGVNKYLGCFLDKELAKIVIIEAREKYHGIYGRQL